MTNTRLYGIPNCDTMKKVRRWLDERAIAYRFHDYKKEGVDKGRLRAWVGMKGWEMLLNRRGTTFRKLPAEDKADIDTERAITLMVAHPSCIKRPVLEYAGGVLVGFDEGEWQDVIGRQTGAHDV